MLLEWSLMGVPDLELDRDGPSFCSCDAMEEALCRMGRAAASLGLGGLVEGL
jgi:hypothetical protein